MSAFEVMDIVSAARERDRAGVSPATCHLEVGQPSAPAPAPVLDAAREALGGPLGYSDAIGTAELRDAISRFYSQRYGVAVGSERIAVTSGASAGFVLLLLAMCDPGDRVAVFEPGYPCYANIADALGVEVTTIHLDASTSYRPTVELLDAAVRGPLNALIVASPSNPTGTALDEAALAELGSWCSANDTTLVVDEIYHGTSTTRLTTAAAGTDAVVVQSFSKYFCMTGWRLGWMVLPNSLVRSVERLSQNLYLSPNALSQSAAVAAFGATDELDSHAGSYAANRSVLIDALVSAGVADIAPADGAFYVWADLGGWGESSTLCNAWLGDIGVAATPGTDFDSQRGGRFVRFSVAGDGAEITEAAQRLGEWLGAHGDRAAS